VNNTACAAGVDALSDWTIGEAGPTAVTLKNLETRMGLAVSWNTLLGLFGLLIFSGLATVGLKRRKQE
jgi:LPXTG-motif cell wall-anchored protein